MAQPAMLNAYKETRTHFPSSTSFINISIPSKGSPVKSSRTQKSRQAIADRSVHQPNPSSLLAHLAVEGSIHFRQSRRYPRSILCRLLSDRKTLELRALDLTRSTLDQDEAKIVLRLTFPSVIPKGGIALADPEDGNALSVFVLTQGSALFVLSLRPDFFVKKSATDGDGHEWVKKYTPAAFSLAQPHRIHAISPFEIFVSLDSGALVRMQRNAKDDGAHWKETTYNDGAWVSSIRGLIRWQGNNTVRHDGRSLDQSTLTAIAATTDSTWVFGVSLNHRLKGWNLETGQTEIVRDLLNRNRQPQDVTSVMLNPSESGLVKVIKAERAREGDRFYLVTYSPHEDGQFKFWAVKGTLTGPTTLEDLFPEDKLRPPDPDPRGNTIWNLADFAVKGAESGRGMEMWVLWQNNNNYKLYSLGFDLLDLNEAWTRNWTATSREWRQEIKEPTFTKVDSADVTEQWLDHLLYPYRYPESALEAALQDYSETLPHCNSLARALQLPSLRERLSSVVGSSVVLGRDSELAVDFEQYREAVDEQWRQFSRITNANVTKMRAAISLAYDSFTDMPWIISADGCSAIRECNSTELIYQNEAKLIQGNVTDDPTNSLSRRWRHRKMWEQFPAPPSIMAQLLYAATSFRSRFPSELEQACKTTIGTEVLQDPSQSPALRIEHFYESCNFAQRVDAETFEALDEHMKALGGYSALSSQLFFATIDASPIEFRGRGRNSNLRSTAFGAHLLAQGAQEMILMNAQILEDLLILVVFIEMEIHNTHIEGGEPLQDFDAAELYASIFELLKQFEATRWLVSNTRTEDNRERESQPSRPTASIDSGTNTNAGGTTLTIVEDLFVNDVKPIPPGKEPASAVLTTNIQEVVSWVNNEPVANPGNALVYVQCNFLINNDLDLAADFLKYQPRTPWSTYIKGRYHLARFDPDTAAIYFQKAAYGLGKPLGLPY